MRKLIVTILILLLYTICLIGSSNEKIVIDKNVTKTSEDTESIIQSEEIDKIDETEDKAYNLLEKVAKSNSKDECYEVIFNYIKGEWLLKSYINLAWYPTGEDNDEELRTEYEKKHVDYLGKEFEFDKDNLTILDNADSIFYYEDELNYIYRFSVNKQLVAPILEVFCTYQNKNVRFIFDSSGAEYFEYQGYFFEIRKLDM